MAVHCTVVVEKGRSRFIADVSIGGCCDSDGAPDDIVKKEWGVRGGK